MDNRIHFKTKSPNAQIKQVINNEQKKIYYSEESGGDSPNSQQQLQQINLKLATKVEFQTDDSDGTPQNIQRKNQTQKQSKFKEQSSKTNSNHEQKDQNQVKKTTKEEQKSQFQSLEEQAKNMQNKYSGKQLKPLQNEIVNYIVNSGHSSLQNLHANSESETKKVILSNLRRDQMAQHPFRHLIFGPMNDEKVFLKHLTICQRGLAYATHCLKGPSDKFIQQKQVILPQGDKNLSKTLLLDLDETLIHACQAKEQPQVYVMAYGENGESARVLKFSQNILVKIGINIRPYVEYFLSTLSKIFNIYLFTASSAAYANAIIDYIDPESKFILGILTRLNCMETKNGFFIKDLRILKDKKLKDLIIVDNLTHSFGFQMENGVPILEWHEDPQDQELKYLVNYLVEASKSEDVRVYNKSKLKLHELLEFNIEQI